MKELEILEKIRERLLSENDAPGAGEGGAANEGDAYDALSMYVGGIVDDLIEYGFADDEETLMGFIIDVADALTEEGDLPPLPEEGDPEESISIWVGTAKTMAFDKLVKEIALEVSDEE